MRGDLRRLSWLGRQLVREPLVLFFAVGTVLFAVAPRPTPDDRLHLSRKSVRALIDAEARRQHVAALPAPAAASVAARAVDDELLYREGLRLGVDKNDNIVRARVVEKMLFLAEDLAGAARPVSDDELARYLDAHADAFRRPTRVSFVHVFASSDAAALARLRPTLPRGTDGEAAEPPVVGEAFPIGRRVVDSPLELVTRSYGRALAASVASLPLGEWSAPVRSPFGWHLVKVVARRGGSMPTIDEVRGEVRLAYLADRKQRATADFMRQLHARYHVTLDDAADASPIAAGAAPPRESD